MSLLFIKSNQFYLEQFDCYWIVLALNTLNNWLQSLSKFWHLLQFQNIYSFYQSFSLVDTDFTLLILALFSSLNCAIPSQLFNFF